MAILCLLSPGMSKDTWKGGKSRKAGEGGEDRRQDGTVLHLIFQVRGVTRRQTVLEIR